MILKIISHVLQGDLTLGPQRPEETSKIEVKQSNGQNTVPEKKKYLKTTNSVFNT